MNWKQLARILGFSASRRRERWVSGTAGSASGSRNYRLWVPDSYRTGKAAPLVMMLHGCGQKAMGLATLSGMNAIADRNGFLVVYPEQATTASLMGCWNWFNPEDQLRGGGEPSILAAIVSKVQSTHDIDADRVYVAGLSAGAAMAIVLAATYPDLFAAVGATAGLEFKAATGGFSALNAMKEGGPDPEQQGTLAFNAMSVGLNAKPKNRFPVIVFHGTDDSSVGPLNADQVIIQWAKTNDCLNGNEGDGMIDRIGELENGEVPEGYGFQRYRYKDSAGRLLMEKWIVKGMAHAWSGSQAEDKLADPKGPNASEEMWRFFCETTNDSTKLTRLGHLVGLT
jgi:poly(hydroxyalkanoate) depolymerase family esterase